MGMDLMTRSIHSGQVNHLGLLTKLKRHRGILIVGKLSSFTNFIIIFLCATIDLVC